MTSRGRALVAAIACAVLACGATACRKAPEAATDAGPSSTATGEPAAPTTNLLAPAVTDSPYGDPFAPDAPHELPPEEAPRDNILIPTGSVEVPGQPAAPPPVDPFDAAIASVRASAVGCFAGQAPGEYTARLSVAVTPSGRATRVEVENASVSDAAVLKCLEQAASNASYPTTDSGRKLSIDVKVKG